MNATAAKEIGFTIEDNLLINKIFGVRGTLYVKIEMNFESFDWLSGAECSSDWDIRFKSNFSEEMTSITEEQEDQVRDTIVNYLSDDDLWKLPEGVEYDLSDFDKSTIEEMIGLKDEVVSSKALTQINVCVSKLNSFKMDERELLVQFADLMSQNELEPKIIIYHLDEVLDALEDEDEYKDQDFTEFKIRINNLVQAGADQYIFD